MDGRSLPVGTKSRRSRSRRGLVGDTCAVVVVCLVLCVWSEACGGSSKQASVSSGSTSQVSTTQPKVDHSTVHVVENDDHISVYGHEAVGSERQLIVGIVDRYYAALVRGDGATACSLLLPGFEKAVPEDYGKAPGPPALRGKTCVAVMSKLARNAEGQSVADLAATKVTGVRVRGSTGFVQLSSPIMSTGEIAIARVGSSWRLQTLLGRACADCAPS